MRTALAVAVLAVAASAGDSAGTTVTWSCESEITGKTGEKSYG